MLLLWELIRRTQACRSAISICLQFKWMQIVGFISCRHHQFTSAAYAAEMVEVYWQALFRDVPFNEYIANATQQLLWQI